MFFLTCVTGIFLCILCAVVLLQQSRTMFASPIHVSRASHAYFDGLTSEDISARCPNNNLCTRNTLHELYTKAVISPSAIDPVIRRRVKELRASLRHMLNDCQWKQALTIRYTVALLANTVENAFPHTHGSIICLPLRFFSDLSSKSQLETFAHEFVHVYQRHYPDVTARLLLRWGYSKATRRPTNNVAGLRSNPDLDAWLYARNGVTGYMQFTSDTPTALTDARLQCAIGQHPCDCQPFVRDLPSIAYNKEHPYEVMAYVVAHILMCTSEEHRHALALTSTFFQDALNWMHTVHNN
jgi:hypothetical protein